jgi:hypothetical protein
MSELFDSEFMNKLQRLVITSKIILEGNTGGNRKSRSKGSSVEFSDYREYASGDEVAHPGLRDSVELRKAIGKLNNDDKCFIWKEAEQAHERTGIAAIFGEKK